MSYYRHIYYNLLAIQNNFILTILLIGNSIVPNYFNDQIIKYKFKGDEYYKYILILSIGDEIQNKYNIDMISIGLQIYDKYKSININEKKDEELDERLKIVRPLNEVKNDNINYY